MTTVISKAGFGKTGYCKLCAWVEEPELNKRLKAGWNAAKIAEWMAKFNGPDSRPMTVNRATVYSHRNHITSGRDKVVAFAERARQNPVIKAASNRQFLEAVRDVGMSKAMDNPEDITISDALKAVQIMEQSKERTGDVYVILAQIATGNFIPPAEIIEGTATPA